MKCKICDSEANLFEEGEVLGKYSVSYYRCSQCGFMQTEEPYWLEESYSKAITSSDIGLISRNLALADVTKRLILAFLNPEGKFIDYGGGYGMFVRLMRDDGYDFYRNDPLCENLFSVGFDFSDNVSYDLLTAWEVFEHLVDPLAEIEKMIGFSQSIVFSTQLLTFPPQPLGRWWYYGLEHGQHVSFYTKASLEIIARKFGLILVYSDGLLHWFRKTAISSLKEKVVFSTKLPWVRRMISKRPPSSLLQKDFEKLTGLQLK
jgi:hypothetical protein